VALSCGSPRLAVSKHSALWSPDFPRSDCSNRGYLADSPPGLFSQKIGTRCVHGPWSSENGVPVGSDSWLAPPRWQNSDSAVLRSPWRHSAWLPAPWARRAATPRARSPGPRCDLRVRHPCRRRPRRKRVLRVGLAQRRRCPRQRRRAMQRVRPSCSRNVRRYRRRRRPRRRVPLRHRPRRVHLRPRCTELAPHASTAIARHRDRC
jgi:hypothetical protein